MTTETKPKTKRQPPPPGAAWRTYKVAMPGSTPKPARPGQKRPVSACAAGGGHHWRIEEANNGKRLLDGVCRKCGATRADFRAGGDILNFKDHADAVYAGQRGGTRIG